jgi:hypothetical protein
LVKLSLCPDASSCHCLGISEVDLVHLGFLVLPVVFVHSLDCSTVHEIAIASKDFENELVVLVYNGVSGVDDLRWESYLANL